MGVSPLRSVSRVPVACGVDIGTTNAKIVALDPEGAVVSRVRRDTPRDDDGLSIDALTLLRVIEEMVDELCGSRYEVHAICTAGVGEDGVLIDSGRQPLVPALAWFDPRRKGVFRAISPGLGDEDAFDVVNDPVQTLVGWTWATAQPRTEDAVSWIALADFAGMSWSGRPFISDTLASRTGAWRSRDRLWAVERVLQTLGSTELLPPLIPAGEIVGDLVSPRLSASGVIAGDAITVAGGHDHPVGGWGADQLMPGVVLDSMGTAEVVVAQSRVPGLERAATLDVAPGIQSPGTTVLRVEELGRNVRWASQDPAVAEQLAAVLSGRTSPEPVLQSGYFMPGNRGGGRPSYAANAPRDPLARASAVLGAMALRGREAVDAVRQCTTDCSGTLLAGGWVRSPGWLAIKSDVNGCDVAVIEEPEVTAVSAALLAAQARGWTVDPARALSGIVGG